MHVTLEVAKADGVTLPSDSRITTERETGVSSTFTATFLYDPPIPARPILERVILQDEVVMEQLRPAMIALEQGKLLEQAIPYVRSTPKSKK